MSKRNKIIYWIATIWLALGMTSTGIVQPIRLPQETEMFAHLGYPAYLLTLLGVWKLLGVIAVRVPKFPLVKEWAYAGFFFAMLGAVVSHFAIGDEAKEFLGPTLLLVLTVVSWYFRLNEKRRLLKRTTHESESRFLFHQEQGMAERDRATSYDRARLRPRRKSEMGLSLLHRLRKQHRSHPCF
jgi:hypothetical protein